MGVVAIAAVLLSIVVYAPPAFAVHVTTINFASKDDACATNYAVAEGFNTSIGAAVRATLSFDTLDHGGCLVRGLNATTPGFTVTGTDLPLQVYASTNLTFTIHVPFRAFTGPLNLSIS